MKLKQILSLIAVIIWMSVIFMFSNQAAEASSKASGDVVNKTLKVIKIDSKNVSEETKIIIEKIVRKIAHLAIYFVLGFLIANLLNTYDVIDKHIIIYSILFSAIYACTDEIHQFFIEGRTCLPTDVIIDALGAAVGMQTFLVIRLIKRKLF